MSIFTAIKSFFTPVHKPAECMYEISFNSEDTDYGTHGYIIARNRKIGINVFCQVRFVFKGMTTPPPLTEHVIADLFASARNKGYEVSSLKTYGLKVMSKQPQQLDKIISAARMAAESGMVKLPQKKGAKHGTTA